MIVFNLFCSQSHRFDGWFRSADDFEAQSGRGLVECPLCGDRHVEKLLSAPRINSGTTERENASTNPREVLAATMIPGVQAHMLAQFKAYVLANTENVGADFAETARRIHYGEETKRNIRGRISLEDAAALAEEGIDTLSLPPGIALDEGVH